MSIRTFRVWPLALLPLIVAGCGSIHGTGSAPEGRPAAAAPADTLRVYTLWEGSTPPSLTNVSDAVRLMARNHPPRLREASRGGTVVLMVELGRDGRVRSTRIHQSSGDGGMDTAALRAAPRLRGTAARVGGTPVAVELEIPFDIGVGP